MLEVSKLSFAYDRHYILDEVTFTVNSGEVVALVGANGSGKTTLLRVLATLAYPLAGLVRADGWNVARDPLRFRRMLGYLPEKAPVEEDMRVAEYLRFRAQVKGEQARKVTHRVAEALNACALKPLARETIGRLSFGQRRLVAFAEAILLRPRFLLVDDVLAGIDPATQDTLSTVLATYSQFASVLVTGHDLTALGRFAHRFIVLKDGQITEAQGGVEEVRRMLRT